MKKSLLLLFYFISLVNILSAQTVTGRLVNQNGDGLAGLQLQLYITPKVYATTSGTDGTFTFNNITGVWNEQLPTGYTVSDNYPNPFYPKTRLNITLPKTGKVRIDIYNLLGQKVVNGQFQYLNAGENSIDLEFSGLMNGYYVSRITIDDKYSVAKKMMLFDESQRLPTGVKTVLLNKSASFVKSTQDIKIDSLVVTGSSIGKKVFKSLPNITGNLLALGNLTVTGTNNLLAGTVFYNGNVTRIGLVSYMDGTKLMADSAYTGQILVFFHTPISDKNATDIISANGGTVLGKVPNVGYYFVGVPSGGEGTFISSMRLNQAIHNALPHVVARYMSTGVTYIDGCKISHGNQVNCVIKGALHEYASPNCMDDDDGDGRPMVKNTIENIYKTLSEANGGNAVINISSFGGYSDGTDYSQVDSTRKAEIMSRARNYLYAILTPIAELPEYYRENLVITLCAGNDNTPMTEILDQIRTDVTLANVLKNNVLIVGANEAVFHNSNDAPNDPDFANMQSVNDCGSGKGTSFAAPLAAAYISNLINDLGITAKQALNAVKIAVMTNSNNEFIEDEAYMIANMIKSGNKEIGFYSGGSNLISKPYAMQNCTQTMYIQTNVSVALDGSLGYLIVPTHFWREVVGQCAIVGVAEDYNVLKGSLTLLNNVINGSAVATFKSGYGSFTITEKLTGTLNSIGVIEGTLSITSEVVSGDFHVTLKKQ